MQKRSFKVKCPNNHQSSKLCSLKFCQNPATICNQQPCLYSKIHYKCITSANTQDLIKSLINKANSQIAQLDELILSCIEKMIKQLEILRDEYLSSNRDYESKLKEENKIVFDLLKNETVQQLKPKEIYRCVKNLNKKQTKQDQSRKMIDDIKDSIENVLIQFAEITKEIRKYWKPEEIKHQYSFSNQLTNFEFIKIQNQGQSATKIKQDENKCTYSLIQPAISSLNNKIQLKLIKKESHVYVGAGRKQQLRKSEYKCFGNREGYYILSSGGYAYNHLNQEQYHREVEFKFKQGDTLEIEYIFEQNSLSIKNLDEGSSYCLTGITNQDQDLHFCIGTYKVNDQFQIMSQINQQL